MIIRFRILPYQWLSPDNDELLYTLQVIAITLYGLKGEDE